MNTMETIIAALQNKGFEVLESREDRVFGTKIALATKKTDGGNIEDDLALIRPQTHRSPRMDTIFKDWIDGEVLDKKQTYADNRNPVWYIKVKKCKKVLDKTDEV